MTDTDNTRLAYFDTAEGIMIEWIAGTEGRTHRVVIADGDGEEHRVTAVEGPGWECEQYVRHLTSMYHITDKGGTAINRGAEAGEGIIGVND